MAIWHVSEYDCKHRVLSHARDSYLNMHIKVFDANNFGDPSRMEIHRNVHAMLEDMNFLVVSCSLTVYYDRPISQN